MAFNRIKVLKEGKNQGKIFDVSKKEGDIQPRAALAAIAAGEAEAMPMTEAKD